ncbi:MAG: DNA polymerase III subunit delta' [Oligoflexia bacterium]|nr:MAG: DNA polymerase III subunit delta' [Oligoflexia bacterium]
MARLLSSIIGHDEQIRKLLEARKQNHLPSTFLFVGPKGVGKKAVAQALAQALLCEKIPTACGECGPCLRVAKGQSEALLMIEPEKTQIKIEQSREIIEFLSLKSMTKARVVIVDSAETLNPQASNALLKILEEPPENSFFFLIAPSSQHVLPTLRSRSQIVHFAPIDIESMKKKSRAPEWALRASQGSFEKLANLLEKGELESREEAIEFVQMWLGHHDAYLLPEWKEMIKERTSALSLARHLALIFRDACFYASGDQTHLLNPDKKEILQKMAAIGEEKLFEVTEQVLKLEGSLLANRDSQLLFEEFWIQTCPVPIQEVPR